MLGHMTVSMTFRRKPFRRIRHLVKITSKDNWSNGIFVEGSSKIDRKNETKVAYQNMTVRMSRDFY